MSRMTFINLPVKDLAKATEFFTKLGFSFDPMFTDENATRMIVSDDTSDTAKSREVLVGLSAQSRQEVDDLADKAIAAGAHSLGDAEDDGFMYMRGFRDLDGHQWSFIYMDMSAVQ